MVEVGCCLWQTISARSSFPIQIGNSGRKMVGGGKLWNKLAVKNKWLPKSKPSTFFPSYHKYHTKRILLLFLSPTIYNFIFTLKVSKNQHSHPFLHPVSTCLSVCFVCASALFQESFNQLQSCPSTTAINAKTILIVFSASLYLC